VSKRRSPFRDIDAHAPVDRALLALMRILHRRAQDAEQQGNEDLAELLWQRRERALGLFRVRQRRDAAAMHRRDLVAAMSAFAALQAGIDAPVHVHDGRADVRGRPFDEPQAAQLGVVVYPNG
jgi:hypothetical protein